VRALWLVPALALGLAVPAEPGRSAGGSTSHSHGGSSHSGSSRHYHSGGSPKGSGGSHKKSGTSSSHRKPSNYCATCPRDSHGRIKRSPEAREQFMRGTGYAHGRKGYVVDHRVPLACGGADSPSNMQWQTKAEAKAKDKTERKQCGR
jgi:hypothetical protein